MGLMEYLDVLLLFGHVFVTKCVFVVWSSGRLTVPSLCWNVVQSIRHSSGQFFVPR